MAYSSGMLDLLSTKIGTPMITEHELVVLIKDWPAQNLRAGECGTVVRVHQGGDECDIEFFSPDGETSRILAVPAFCVETPPEEMLMGCA